jgi:DNA repair protein RadC
MKEFRIITLRECATEPEMVDAPEKIAAYWRTHIQPNIDGTREHLVVFLLNVRCRLIGHELIGMGTLNSVLLASRDIFRLAIMQAAHSVVIAHNHPSGDPEPSPEDVRGTRAMVRAGQVLGIELMDHVVIGFGGKFASLKALGLLYEPTRRRRSPK